MIEIRQASKTLDSLGIAAIDVLKIDTEGCELPILADRASVIPAIKLIDLEFRSKHDRACGPPSRSAWRETGSSRPWLPWRVATTWA